MKYFSMLRSALFTAAVIALSTLRLGAQQLDNPVTYSVTFQPSITANSSGGGYSGSIVDETGTTRGFGVGAGPNQSATGTSGSARLLPNKDYTVSISPGSTGFTQGQMKFSLPSMSGMAVYIAGLMNTSTTFTSSLTTFKVRIALPNNYPLASAPEMLRGGEATSIVADKPIWYVGLGRMRNGMGAGAIGFRRQDFSADIFTPSALYYDTTDITEVDVVKSAGVLRQVFSREVLADIQAVNSTQYQIKVYGRSQVGAFDGTVYSVSGQTPFVTYTVQQITNGIKITRTEDGVDWETSLETSNAVWTRKDWHLSSITTPSIITTTFSPTTLGTVTHTGPASGLSGDTGLTWTKTFYDYVWSKELTETKYGTGTSALTSSFSYYDSTGSGAFAGMLKSSVDSSGNWTKYEYYDFSTPNGAAGSIKRVYRPWLDSPTSPDTATTANSVVEEYTYETMYNWPTKVVTTAPGGTLSASQWSYGDNITLNGETAIPATRYDFANATDYAAGTNGITTITTTFSPNTLTPYFRGLPVSTTYPNGRKVSYAYFKGDWAAGTNTFTASATGNDRFVLAFDGQTTNGTATTSWVKNGQTWNMDTVNLVTNLSTVAAAVTDSQGRQVFSGTYLYTGASSLTLIAGSRTTYDSHGRVSTITDAIRSTSSTTTYTASAVATYPLSIEVTAADGVKTRSDFDGLLRLVSKTEGVGGSSSTPEKVHMTTYDAVNRPVADYPCSCGTSPTRYFYDSAGRLSSKREISPNDLSTTTDGALITSYDYSTAGQVTTTLPTGATRTESVYLDGRAKAVTGTAQPSSYLDYSLNATGVLVKSYAASSSDKTNGWSETQGDWLGRTVKYSAPAYGWSSTNATAIIDIVSTYDTNTSGTLAKQTTTYRADSSKLAPAKLFFYGADGRLTTEGYDLDGSNTLTASSNDRVIVHDSGFEQDTLLAWWAMEQTKTYPTVGSPTLVQTGKTLSRLTSFGTGTIAETVNTDANGRVTTQTTAIDATTKRTTITRSVSGVSNTATQITQNGYDFETTSLSGERVRRTYDSKGRLQYVKSRPSAEDIWGATDSLTYYNGTKFVSTQVAAGVTTTYNYAWGPSSRTVSSATTVDTSSIGLSYVVYDAKDLPWRTYGPGASPTELGYDSRGRRTTLTTWRSGSFTGTAWPTSPGTGDTTTWTLDSTSGLVTQKAFADTTHTDYTYTVLGQPKTRTWARPGSVKTTYDYYDGTSTTSGDVSHYTQELKSITYSDSTQPLVYTYKRSGLPAGVSDWTGSRVLTYDATYPFQVQTETLGAYYGGRIRTINYDAARRATGFKLGTSSDDDADLSQTGDYVAANGLLNHLYSASNNGTARTFTYAYVAGTSRLDNYTSGSFTTAYDYDATSAARRNKIDAQWSGTSRTRFDLAFDARGLVQSVKQSGSAFSDYFSGTSYSSTYNAHAYDALGELQTTAMYRGAPPSSGTPPTADELPGRRFEYRYDQAGNRTTSGATGTASGGDDEYVATSLNQYSSKENNTVRILGTASVGANAGAQSSSGGALTVNKKDRSFAADVLPLNNSANPAQGTVGVYAAVVGTGPGGSDLVAMQQRTWQIAKQLQSFTYDADGNLTDDGVWLYQYDAENRLIRMETLPAAYSAGLTRWVLEFKYDFMGRRVQKRSNNVTAGTDVYRGYLYDGWNVVAEYTVNSPTTSPACGTLQRSFTWGLDLVGSTNATGGVGALVQITDHSIGKTYFPSYDGNGNVSALVDASDGSLAAIYEYSPFGELLRSEGTYAASNPIRFSTKWTDVESGLSYYGLRYYSPALGRFINRDPIEESGGMNLYSFAGNNAINSFDILGMCMWIENFQTWNPVTGELISHGYWDCSNGAAKGTGDGGNNKSGGTTTGGGKDETPPNQPPDKRAKKAPNKSPTPCEKLKAGIAKVGQSIHSAIDSFSDINGYFADANTNAWLSLGQSAGFAAYGITGVTKGIAANAAKTSANLIRAGAGDVPIGIWTSTGRTATVGTAAFATAAVAETGWRNTSALVIGSQEAIPDVAQYLAADLYDPVSRVLDPAGNLAETQIRTGDALSKQTASTVKQMQSSYKALQELYDQNCR